MHTNLLILKRLANIPDDELDAIIAVRRSLDSDKTISMLELGYQEYLGHDGNVITEDGREIVQAYDRRWVLLKQAHSERLEKALATVDTKLVRKEQETKSAAGTDNISSLVCSKCGDSLQHTRVCTSCAAGQLGYRHRYSCVCGVDFISKEEL